jgi:short-subunit dehydrogenase
MIVGATGGIGLALVREYAARGWTVGLLGRDSERLRAASEELRRQYPSASFPYAVCDVRDASAVATAFHALGAQLGTLDLMVYAGGVMTESRVDTLDFSGEAEMFAVNTVGAVQIIGLAAQQMHRQRRGHLAAIGSIAGERGRKGNPAYGASKAALHTYLEGMRNRLHPLGIRVSTIKPGFVKTRMLGGKHYPGAISPEAAARRIADALQSGSQSFFVPSWWGLVALAVRACPSVIFKRFGPP